MDRRTILVVLILVGLASAQCPGDGSPPDQICQVICLLYRELIPVARALAALMFTYGGAKYVYSADDPGGRKQGKSVAINALIGLIIVSIAGGVVQVATGVPMSC